MAKDAGQILLNNEANISEVIEFIDDLDGFGLVLTDPDALAAELESIGFYNDQPEED